MGTKFTPQAVDRIVQAITVGSTYELAAQYGGVTYQTFRNWILRGEAEIDRAERARKHTDIKPEEAAYVDFVERVRAAEGTAAFLWLAKIEKAASDGSWQAAAWKLERRYPQDYGRTVVDQNWRGPGEGGAIKQEVTLDLSNLTIQQLAALAAWDTDTASEE